MSQELTAVEYDPFADGPISRVVPTTEPQREIWLADRLSPEASLAFNESGSLRLHGSLDTSALRLALNNLLARHDALRGTFGPDGQTLCIQSNCELALSLQDLSSLAEDERASAITAELKRAVETPFNLEQGPLFRASLMPLGADDHLLILTAHHVVCDGWSWGILRRELSMLYSAHATGDGLASMPPASSFADYCVTATQYTSTPAFQADERFWLSQFASSVPVLDLPLDRARPSVRTFAAARVDHALDADLVARLKRKAGREGASLFGILLSAFAVLISRLCQQSDLVVGIATAGQSVDDEHARVVGHAVNVLPIRFELPSGASFAEFLRETQSELFDALEHQRYTFGTLLKRLRVQRDPSRLPLVSVVFNLETAASADQLQFEGLNVESASNARTFENFELFVNCVQRQRDVVLEVQFKTDLFDAATIQRWFASYETLLRYVAGDAATLPISQLPLLSPQERSNLLGDSAPFSFPRGDALHRRFERQAVIAPDAIAMTAFTVDGKRQEMSYAELDRRADLVAQRLRGMGVTRNTLVGLRTGRSAELVIGLLAILKAGGAYLPLDPVYPKDRVAFMLNDAGVSLVLTETRLEADLDGIAVASLCLDADLGSTASELPHHPVEAASPDDLAYVIYTSGSTGKPKGVRVTHHNVVRLFAATEQYSFNEHDVWTLFHSYAFDFSVWELWGALLYGGRVIVVPHEISRDMQAFHALLVRERVTILNQTPTAFRQLINVDAAGPKAHLSLRYVIFGGEALELQSLRPWFERYGDTAPRLVNMYGITETTVHVTYREITMADLLGGAGSVIGRPIADLRVYLLDANAQPVPVGVPGEMYVAGAGVADGYLNRTELTAERFVPDPFHGEAGARIYRSGDLARRLDSGDLEYLGRIDQQVKIRGFRIELGEIEAAMSQLPELGQVAVVDREDVPGDKRLVAYLVGGPSDAEGIARIREKLRAVLPEYMVPSHFLSIEVLPLTQNGKLDRCALPAPSEAGSHSRVTFVAPSSEAEMLVAEIWMRQLSIERVSVTENFFDLGGHSLLAMSAVLEIQKRLGVQVDPTRMIFETLGQIAATPKTEGTKAAKGWLTRLKRAISTS